MKHSQKLKNSIIIDDGVTHVEQSMFENPSSITSITLPNSVTSIDLAFKNFSSLAHITIPESVTSIGDYAFCNCSSLTQITIPESVTYIGLGAFYGCSSLAHITIPESVTSIGDSVFYSCSGLTHITIPESVTSIGDYAFKGCSSLAHITIPESVTSIGDYAFEGCSSLAHITIPESVTSIGDSAFFGCSNLEHIILPDHLFINGQPPAFGGINPVTKIYKLNEFKQQINLLKGHYSEYQNIVIFDIISSSSPDLELFQKAYQFILPRDLMRIIESLRNEKAIIPTKARALYTKLTKMRRHTLEILDFLPVIEIIRTSSICQFIPSSPVRSLGLFGNQGRIVRSSTAEEMTSNKHRNSSGLQS